MGMAALLIVFISIIRDLGTGTAIIQRPTITNGLLSTLFWVNCGFGALIAMLVVATSPIVAHFFHQPQLTPILCAISISLWLNSAGIVHNSLLMRNMQFRPLAIADLGSGLAGYVAALISAYSGLGVWSLVYANITAAFTSTAVYWATAAWRPDLEFDRHELRTVAKFSLNLSGFGLTNYFARNSDNLIIGKVLGPVALGNYQVAYNLMLTPLQNVSSVIGQVTLPAFAQIQDDNERFRSAYLRSSSIIALLTFPMMAGLGIVADPLIHCVLGSKWLGAIPIFQILAPIGLIQSVQTLIAAIYIAKGRTDWFFRWGLYTCAVLIAAFLVGVRFGAVGVAVAYFITYLVLMMVPGFLIPFSLIGLRMRDYLWALFPQALLTAGMSIICWLCLYSLGVYGITNNWVRLITTSLLGAGVYTIALYLRPIPAVRHITEILGRSNNRLALKFVSIIESRTSLTPRFDLPN
jgi:PST family polysaccharide transporter